MLTETVDINGLGVLTLKELLRPGLRAVFVGINPSLVSVEAGHYYQGRLGKRFWSRIQGAGIARALPPAREDEAAFDQGLGFVDLVRRPTPRAKDLDRSELVDGAQSLVERVRITGNAPVVFVFTLAFNHAAPRLERVGRVAAKMPGPYAPREVAYRELKEIARLIG